MFKHFLNEQPERTSGCAQKMHPCQIGGDLYPRFRKWFTAALAAESGLQSEEIHDKAEQERTTAALLKRIQDFAIDHLKGSPQKLSFSATGVPASGLASVRKAVPLPSRPPLAVKGKAPSVRSTTTANAYSSGIKVQDSDEDNMSDADAL